MAKKILFEDQAPIKLTVKVSSKDAAIISLRYLTALHSKEGLTGNCIDPYTFHTGLLQIRQDYGYLEAVAYWSGEVHPAEHDLPMHADDAGLSEHFGENLRKKPKNYTPPLSHEPEESKHYESFYR